MTIVIHLEVHGKIKVLLLLEMQMKKNRRKK
jgi:hypothetical protein